MNWRLVIGLCLVVASTVGLFANRSSGVPLPPLGIRRVTPIDLVLRGSPNVPVVVELELTNSTGQPIELAPLNMSCSCQIATAPDAMIAAGGTTKCVLSLRYPPARQSLVPVEFKSPTGELLARTDIVLEADLVPPYFMLCPDAVEIPIISGVSDPIWRTSAVTWEEDRALPYLKGVRVTQGAEQVQLTLEPLPDASRGLHETQRTYQLVFEVLDAAQLPSAESPPVRGMAMLDLSDGTARQLPWSIVQHPPLALVFDARSGSLRGVRRAGASGVVTLHVIPAEGGTLLPDRFEAGVKVVAQLQPGAMKAQSIEVRYEGEHAVVPISVTIP